MPVRERLDEIDAEVMAGLKPFQRATVRHIDALYRSGRTRVLLADEVGLGKTMVARGVISKMLKLRRQEQDDLVKVVYICPSTDIARQNLRRLAIDGAAALSDVAQSRLSMQHLRLARERNDDELRGRYLQLIPLTPATSFRLSSGTGTMDERALMRAVLRYDRAFLGEGAARRRRRLDALLWARTSRSSEETWRAACAGAEREVGDVAGFGPGGPAADPSSRHAPLERPPYPYDVLAMVKGELGGDGSAHDGETLTFADLVGCLDAPEAPTDSDRRRIIVALRQAFSKASIDMMRPDFVVMDEFQRFRDLIVDNGSEMSLLARRFFGGDERVLLLSATPFRLYSTAAESADVDFDDSYSEFTELMRFLTQGQPDQDRFGAVWRDYTHALLSARPDDRSAIVACLAGKDAAQAEVSRAISRTERTSTDELADILDVRGNVRTCPVGKDDVLAYFGATALLRDVGVPAGEFLPDYAKSCPLPFSFMRGYKVKDRLNQRARGSWDSLDKDVRKFKRLLWVDSRAVSAFKPLSLGHARFNALERDLFDERNAKGAPVHPERLLWIPASRPYYVPTARSPYRDADRFSKTLVFSAWAMVPTALATLLSYDALQRDANALAGCTGASYRYGSTSDERDAEESDAHALPSQRLRMTSTAGRGANAFALVYPSPYLARAFDPVATANRHGATLVELRRAVRRRIAADLCEALGVDRLPAGAQPGDPSWYPKAMLLLDDRLCGGRGASTLDALVRGCREKGYAGAQRTFERLRDAYARWDPLADMGRMPHALADALADAAIGGPAVCALRAYRGVLEGTGAGGEGVDGAAVDDVPDAVPAFLPFEFGYAFMTRMNTAAATTVIAAFAMQTRRRRDTRLSHWRDVLDYCCEGNLQSVLDEYAHLVEDGLASLRDPAARLRLVHEGIVGERVGNDATPSLHKADTRYGLETADTFKAAAGGRRLRASQLSMRTDYAAAFVEGERGAGAGGARRALVRSAFNSPFRPFVLVSTSIGQEGLDFHAYCRKVVHWNLPSNPVDMEQREGRVNRYKCLAVRQSLAQRYGATAFGSDASVWTQIFARAEREENARAEAHEGDGDVRARGASGLLPYWGVTPGERQVHIERYVYAYPFSRDEQQYRYLLQTVVRYRAVFGQPNQEELLQVLRRRFGDSSELGEDLRRLFINLCPFVLDDQAGAGGAGRAPGRGRRDEPD